MASNYWTEFPEKKQTAGTPATTRAGSTPNMPRKQAFTSQQLPGKASNNFAKMKAGVKEVNGYAAYKGLSESCGMSSKKPKMKKMKHEMAEY